MPSERPRLTPAVADLRRAVRGAVSALDPSASGPVLVALSGGADSLALAAAAAFEGPRAGVAVGAIVVDHGLQDGSDRVAARAADAARDLGLDPVLVTRVRVEPGADGPEAAARAARYAAFDDALGQTGARALLLAHTLDDQAETVLLGLARGSGAASLHGMAASVPARSADAVLLRPLLGIRASVTRAACADQGLEPWRDPHNADPAYARVRVRHDVLPVLERELGPGIAEALARTADQLREDDDALEHFAAEMIEEIADHAEAGISLEVASLEAAPPALRHRLIRLAAREEFAAHLSRTHVLEVARLVTDWRGQGPVDLPGVRVLRRDGLIVLSARTTEE
ncbi:tRNA lysidine(34) synthetase TilS [Clavibacter tessellarius]|uniref:tRNA(Ile)-lysidine synthase n=1 Tax=Clavibacter tessellarius TaxID=31965 RepID=A0A154V2T1_9MICO|nr:tRNA lysidine(34) synthetase TilS [Clavibacter michiganensis]KZC95559.1 tRNA(Ile)-lysidine synthetase [Clavibacter michiganensis subsp. tessellarius]